MPGANGASIYSISEGRIVFISFFETEGTIVTQHVLNDGSEIFAKYTHIAEPTVEIGQVVSSETKIARLMNRDEFKKAKWKQNHVHLEIRKKPGRRNSIRGMAMNKKDLDECCIDPISFLKTQDLSE